MKTTIAMLSLFALVACDEPEPLSQPDERPLLDDPETLADAPSEPFDLLGARELVEASVEPEGADLIVHARVGTSEGSYVEFFSSADDPDDIGIGVMAEFPRRPLVAGDFVAAHDAVDVFMAVAPLDLAVPDELFRVRPDDIAIDTSASAREALKEASAAFLDELPTIDRVPIVASCNTMENWMNGWYGEDGTCANGSNLNKSWTDYELICAYGDSSCDYFLSQSGIGLCNGELDSGHLVRGRTNKVAGRWQKKGNITWGSYGYRSHQAVSNCPSSNGSLRFYRERGGSSWLKYVPKNHGYNYFYGYNTPRPISYWGYGSWKKDYEHDKWNGVKVRDNSGTHDEAIMCADVYNRYRTDDWSYSGSADLCTTGSCDNTCTNN